MKSATILALIIISTGIGSVIYLNYQRDIQNNAIVAPPPPPASISADDTKQEELISVGRDNESDLVSNISVVDAVNDEKKLDSILTKLGVRWAMNKLVAESSGGSIFDCHQQAHTVGRIGYTIHKEKVFGECDASCHSGCYHGAMESFLNKEGTLNIALNIDRICNSFNTGFGVFECLHGVGHGVLAYLDYDLPEALKECKELNGWFSHVSCYGGVFMENILTAQGLGAGNKIHTTEWANNDPHFPCNGIDQDYDVQYQCYQMQTSWMLNVNNYNFDKVSKECLNAPENMITVCFKSFGRDAAGHTLRNPVKILDICNKIPKSDSSYYNECIIGSVNVIIDFWGPGLKGQATELCSLIQDDGTKSVCYSTLNSRLRELFTKQQEIDYVCSTFEENYRVSCPKI